MMRVWRVLGRQSCGILAGETCVKTRQSVLHPVIDARAFKQKLRRVISRVCVFFLGGVQDRVTRPLGGSRSRGGFSRGAQRMASPLKF
eukprot:9467522-Pyramimonas_sp.AAC.2